MMTILIVMELNQLLVLNDFKENWTTILPYHRKNSQSSVENREIPPTSMVANEMLQSNFVYIRIYIYSIYEHFEV